jgi:imidazolonepropionase-like amidohydrolase
LNVAVRPLGPPAIRITIGHLIDGSAANPIDNAAILIEGNRIVEVGPADRVAHPAHAQHLAFPDATALPGLIDAHVHVTFAGDVDPLGTMAKERDEELVTRGVVACERMVRAGVTTAFDCGARNSTGFAIRDAIARRQSVGPRFMASGRPVTQPRGHCHWLNGEADGEADVRRTVARLIDEEGADGIKMMATGGGMTTGTDSRYAAYPVEILAAAADEAHRRGRIITTHAHGVPGIRNAAEAGIDAIQHATMIGPDWRWAFDEDVAALMKARGTIGCVTMAAGIRVELEGGVNVNALQPNPGAMPRLETITNGRRLHEAGVALIPATDVGTTFTDFGEELFFELEVYEAIGFSALETIRMTTRNAARYLGLENVTGQLLPGLVADLLIVNGRPDEDLAALRRGALVVRDGQPIQATPARPSPGLTPEVVGTHPRRTHQ